MSQASLESCPASALRDFFIAADARQMAPAYMALTAIWPDNPPPVGDLDELEFSFNNLFVGPMQVQAPPFASIYLDAEPLVMGSTTLQVRRVYAMLGLESPWKGALPDDHLSLEIDAAMRMRTMLEQSTSTELLALRRWFIFEHMGLWLPRFVERVETSEQAHPAIAWCARRLLDWLDGEKAAFAVAA